VSSSAGRIADVVVVEPLTNDRWGDLEDLFGPNGAVSGCWCMYWRKPGRDPYGRENRAELHERVGHDPPPGLLAYADDRAVGWVQVGRRGEFLRIERSRHLGPIDAIDAWCVNCFYIRRGHRRRGIGGRLLDAAIDFARDHRAAVLEAYPVDRAASSSGDLYTGVPSMFLARGFVEVARRHPSRPILRLELAR
jgi:GNAT superfamily N-acetyltransferase